MPDFGNPEENDGRTDEKLREKSSKAVRQQQQKSERNGSRKVGTITARGRMLPLRLLPLALIYMVHIYSSLCCWRWCKLQRWRGCDKGAAVARVIVQQCPSFLPPPSNISTWPPSETIMFITNCTGVHVVLVDRIQALRVRGHNHNFRQRRQQPLAEAMDGGH